MDPGEKALQPVTLAASYLMLYVVWGANPFFIKLAVSTIPVEWVLAVRFSLAGMVFLFFRHKKLSLIFKNPRSVGSAFLMSLLLLVFGNGIVSLSQKYINSYTVSLILTMIPVLVAVYDRILFGIVVPLPAKAGILLGIAGTVLLLYDGRNLVTSVFMWGNILALLGTLSWSLAISIGKKLPVFEDGFLNAGLQMFFCGILALAVALIRTRDIGMIVSQVSGPSVIGLGYITFLGGSTFAVFNYLLPREPSVRLSTYALVNPVIAVIIGIWIGRELPAPYLLPAIATILTGVICIMYGELLLKRLHRYTPQYKRKIPGKIAGKRMGRRKEEGET